VKNGETHLARLIVCWLGVRIPAGHQLKIAELLMSSTLLKD
jgi:hypothetical protein